MSQSGRFFCWLIYGYRLGKIYSKNGVFMDRGSSDWQNCVITFEKGKDYTATNKVYLVNISKMVISRHILTTRIKSAIMQVKPRKVPKNTRIKNGRL